MNDFKEKLNKFLSRHTQGMIFLWMIVGGYLAYLAWQLLTEDPGEANPAVLTVAAVVFAIVGLIMVAVSLYSLIGKHYKDPYPPVGEEAGNRNQESEDEDR